MKYKILLFGFLAAVATGCSTYRAGQTPDDVYYSPARNGVATKEARQNREDRYEDYASNQDERYLRMKVRDRRRWDLLDDYAYWNDSRYMPSYSYDYYRYNWHNPYSWNSLYSPFNYNSLYITPFYYGNSYPIYGYSPYTSRYISKTPLMVTPQAGVNRPNLNGYMNRSYNNTNTNRSSNIGSTLKRVFAPAENSYNNSNDYNSNTNRNTEVYRAPERSYSPSSSSGSSSSGSSSSGSNSGGVTRPPR